MNIRIFLFCLLLLMFSQLTVSAQLHLNPSDRSGAFITIQKSWSVLPAPDVNISYDGQGLTFQVVLQKPAGETFIQQGKADDDMAIFAGDIFEIQINPPNAGNNYFHFALSPSSFMYTAKKRDRSWNPQGIIKHSKSAGNRWEFSLFVPYTDLETTMPQVNDQWRINLGRTNIDAQGNVEYSSYSGATNFHDIFQYSTVTFGNSDTVKAPLIKQIICDEKSVKCIFDRLSHPEEIIAECSTGDIAAAMPLTAGKAGCSVTVPLDGYIPAKGSRLFSITLKNKTTGKIEFSQTAHLPINPQPDQLVPDRFYYLAGKGSIKIKQLLGKDAVLSLKNDSRCIVRIPNAQEEEKISLQDLAPGRYVLEVQNNNMRTSRVIFILPHQPELQPIPPNAPLKIVDKKYMELAGEPVFFWGTTASAKYFFQFTPAVNFLYGPAAGQPNGVLNPGMPISSKIHRQPVTCYTFPDLESSANIIREYAAKLNPERPALYRIRYEASLPELIINEDGSKTTLIPDERFARMYKEAKKANPDILYTIHIDDPRFINNYVSSCDIFEYASFASSYSPNLMHHFPDDIKHLTTHAQDKPLIFWLGGSVPDGYCRSAEELRCAVYYGIMHNIIGNIVHLGHGHLPESRTRVWSLISCILAEIQTFYADFITGTDITSELRNESSKDIYCKAVRTKKGGIIIIAVNTSPVEATFRSTLDGKVYTKCLTPFEPYVFR